jgi:hypothetical protein
MIDWFISVPLPSPLLQDALSSSESTSEMASSSTFQGAQWCAVAMTTPDSEADDAPTRHRSLGFVTSARAWSHRSSVCRQRAHRSASQRFALLQSADDGADVRDLRCDA